MLKMEHKFEDHAALSSSLAFDFLLKNEVLRDYLRRKQMVFVDGYFVIASEKYISKDHNQQIHLTQWARNNLSECTLNIRKIIREKVDTHSQDDEDDGTVSKDKAFSPLGFIACAAVGMFSSILGSLLLPGLLFSSGSSSNEDDEINSQDKSEIDRRILLLNSEYATLLEEHITPKMNDKVSNSEIYDSALNFLFKEEYSLERQFDSVLGNPDKSLSNCLDFMMEAKGWNKADTFWDHTLLHGNYFFRIKRNQFNKVSKETLMAICVGLGLTIRMVTKVFRKAGFTLQEHTDPDRVYVMILEFFPKISIDNFNNLLIRAGLKPLGTPIKEKSAEDTKTPTKRT